MKMTAVVSTETDIVEVTCEENDIKATVEMTKAEFIKRVVGDK